MSRIHEALKRARMERSDAQETEAGASAQNRHSTIGGNGANDSVETMFSAEPPPPIPSASDSLSFEDLTSQCSHPAWNPGPNLNVFHAGMGARGAEQFRTLRSRLYQLRDIHPLRIVLVTSSVAAEGKTFVVSNLARAIVRQPDRRVLVIDADLRCSRLHLPLGAPPAPGLTGYLRGEESEYSAIQCGPEGNLCLLPGGKTATNPSELLANGRMKTLLDRVAPSFDWVLIDSPPCLPVADASVLANLCDGILLVVKASSTPAAVVQKAHRELQGRNIAGVVLNSVDESSLGYAGYYEYGGYGDNHTEANSARTPTS
jgi:protein-tyrosine kinase